MLKEYWFEVGILLLGSFTALIRFLFIQDVNFSLTIIILSLNISIISISIKREFIKNLAQISSINHSINRIESSIWRKDAEERIAVLCKEFEQWSLGNRNIPINELVPHEVRLLYTAHAQIRAIHTGLHKNNIMRWDPQEINSDLLPLIDTYEKLSKTIQKKRIFTLAYNNLDININDYINNNGYIRRIIERQQALGFEVRVLLSNVLNKYNIPHPNDILIVDDTEGIIVEIDLDGKILRANAFIGNGLRNHIDNFDRLWVMSKEVKL